ncbi:MAG: hypothetical protein OXE56_12175 [Gammaproteobacteria bacterium]|nr:hypothetical protein [Gammaproteobacteria bacterium]
MSNSFEEEWASNEDQLMREANSLGELLARMRGSFSALPISGKHWERVFDNAKDLPPTLAGFPLWIGFSVDESRSPVLLDVSVLGGTRSADYFMQCAKSGNGCLLIDGIASLLDKLDNAGSSLSDIVGNRVLVEYPIEPDGKAKSDCGYFLYPIQPTLAGGAAGQKLSEFHAAYDALSAVSGHAGDGGRRRYADSAYRALDPGTRIGAMGAFVSNPDLFRITALGFNAPGEAMSYLERLGLSKQQSRIASVLERLEARGALSGMQLGVRVDLVESGFAPTLEIQIFSANTIYDQTGWFKDKECWAELIDGLGREQIAKTEKLMGLAEWSGAVKTLIGRSSVFLLLQRIHHFAILLDNNGNLHVNAHVFLLTTRWPNRKE